MNLSSHKNKLLVLSLIAILSLVGCGSKKSGGAGNTDLGSRNPDNNGKAIAECSKATRSTNMEDLGGFEVRLSAYKDAFGRILPQYARLQFKQIPEEFRTENWEINVYRWTTDPSGNTALDPQKLKMYFQARYSGQFNYLQTTVGPVMAGYQRIDFDNEVQPIGEMANVPTTTAQGFFNVVSFLVDIQDPDSVYQVLRVVLRKDGEVQREADILIPTFYANPLVYNEDERHAPVLQGLHPLKDLLGQSWSEDQYKGFTQAWCI